MSNALATKLSFISVLCTLLITALSNPAFASAPLTLKDKNTKAVTASHFGAFPLAFSENQGQTDARVKYLARGKGYTLFLTTTEAVIRLWTTDKKERTAPRAVLDRERKVKSTTLRMKLGGTFMQPKITGVDKLPGVVNYYTGNDRGKWRVNVPTYRKVRYQSVYPGIDLVYYGNQHQLEYDFIVSAGADPAMIEIDFDGAQELKVDGNGNLILSVKDGDVVFRKPFVYQEIEGQKKEVKASYAVSDNGRVSFPVAAYDRTRPLVIDPILEYSTFLGGSMSDGGNDIAVDGAGNMLVTGYTASPLFPTTTGVIETYAAFDTSFNDNVDAFVTKIGSAGYVVYSTFFGGSNDDRARAIALHPDSDFSVTGQTSSPNFPTTVGDASAGTIQAHDKILNSFLCVPGVDCTGTDASDAFVAHFRGGNGQLLYSTFLGGSSSDIGVDIAVGDDDKMLVTGHTRSPDFPTTVGGSGTSTIRAFDREYNGATDAFVTILWGVNPGFGLAGQLYYSTFFGGSDDDAGWGIAWASPFVYVTGFSDSGDIVNPGTPAWPAELLDKSWDLSHNGKSDVFVIKYDMSGGSRPRGSSAYFSYLGGFGDEVGWAIAVNSTGPHADWAYVTGFTDSENFPSTETSIPYDGSFVPGAFVSVLVTEPELLAPDVWETKLYSYVIPGAVGTDISIAPATDGSADVYVTGSVTGEYPLALLFPITDGTNGTLAALDQTPPAEGTTDAFVLKAENNQMPPLFSTFLGGSGDDRGMGIAVKSNCASGCHGPGAERVYVTGWTQSTDFPTTDGTGGTTVAHDQVFNGETDAFVSTISFVPKLLPGIIPALKTKLLIPYQGSLVDPHPEYAWAAVLGGTWYYLRVDDSERMGKIKQWYRASDICNHDLCTVRPSTTLADGPATWRVLTQKSKGKKAGHVKPKLTRSNAKASHKAASHKGRKKGHKNNPGHWSDKGFFTVVSQP